MHRPIWWDAFPKMHPDFQKTALVSKNPASLQAAVMLREVDLSPDVFDDEEPEEAPASGNRKTHRKTKTREALPADREIVAQLLEQHQDIPTVRRGDAIWRRFNDPVRGPLTGNQIAALFRSVIRERVAEAGMSSALVC